MCGSQVFLENSKAHCHLQDQFDVQAQHKEFQSLSASFCQSLHPTHQRRTKLQIQT